MSLEKPDQITKPGLSQFSRPDLLKIGGIIFLSTAIMLPVFVKGFPAGFDAARHYRWTSQFIDALKDGSLYPRWLPTANDGQGSPSIIFYPPLPFYVSAFFSLVNGSILLGISLSCWLALVLSGLGTYKFAKRIVSPSLSFTAAALYILGPYHLLDLYQGTTVSEFWSFAWVPFLFDGVRRVISGRRLGDIVYLSLSYCLLALTHLPVLLLTSLALILYAILLTRKLGLLLRVAGSMLMGATMSAVFLFPAVVETSYIRLFFKFDFRDYFLFEHVRSSFTSSRFPLDGTPDTYLLDNDFVGVGIFILFLTVSLFLFVDWWRDKSKMSRMSLAIWVVTAVGFAMTTRITTPIWKLIPGLTFLFFPYRWLVIASFGASLLTALCLHAPLSSGLWRAARLLLLSAAVIINVLISVIVVLRAPVAPDALAGALNRRDTREYRPVWWHGDLDREKWTQPAVLQSGDAKVLAIDDFGIDQHYEINAGTASVVELRPLYFPGWTARVDGEKRPIEPSYEGHVQLSVQPGDRVLSLRFEDTRARVAGKGISIVGLIIIFTSLIGARRKAATSL